VLEFFHGEVDWGFTLRTPTRNDLHCLPSEALGGGSISVAGIKLGMRKAAYAQVVGNSQKGSANHSENVFQYVHTLTDTELNAMAERGRQSGYPQNDPEELRHWDVGITLSASFAQGHLTSIRVDRVETN
jgi:hypothetical protein